MKKKFYIGKKAIPTWLLVTALVVAGAGAAVGTILAGNVTAEVPVTVSQALLVDTPTIVTSNQTGADLYAEDAPQTVYKKNDPNLIITTEPDRHIATVADDHTAFQVAAEIATGDAFKFATPFKNASSQDMVAELKLVFPEGLSVEVYDPSVVAPNRVKDVVRTGLYTWKLKILAGADYVTPNDIVNVVVAANDTILPGFYTISGEIVQIGY